MAKQGFAKEQLVSLVERVERLEKEKRDIGDDIKEVYSEAKGQGFDTKIMRQIVKLRELDRATLQEQDAIEDLYRAAVGLPSRG